MLAWTKKHNIFIFLIAYLMLGTSPLAAVDNSDVIWTWGNGKFVASIFSWVYYVLNIDSLRFIIKWAATIGLSFLIIKEYVTARGGMISASGFVYKIFIYFVITQGIILAFLTVDRKEINKVYILSANELAAPDWAKCRPVSGDNNCYAPVGIKFIVTSLTNLERTVIGMMEQSMMSASALSYSFSRMGLGFSFTFWDEVSKAKLAIDNAANLDEYFENCIMYDLLNGTKSFKDLASSTDLSSFLISNNSRLTNIYSPAFPNGKLKACYEVTQAELFGEITCQKIASYTTALKTGSPAGEAQNFADACDAFENYGKLAFNTTKTADEQIKQKVIMNATKSSIQNSAIASGIDPLMLAYGNVMGNREQAGKWITMGTMAKDWIPALRGILQGLAIGLIWILAIFALLSASPGRYIGAAIGFQATLFVWSVLLALINYATIIIMTDSLPKIFFADFGNTDMLRLFTEPTFDEKNQKALAFLGYMAVGSFGIAMRIVGTAANMLGSMGAALGQLNLGMSTASNMAKSNQEFGLTSAGSSGTRTVNPSGDAYNISPNSLMNTETNAAGYNNTTTNLASDYGGGTIAQTTAQDKNGGKTISFNDVTGQHVGFNKGGAVKANIHGAAAVVGESLQQKSSQSYSEAASLQKASQEQLAEGFAYTENAVKQASRSVEDSGGSTAMKSFGADFLMNYQSSLQKAFDRGQMTQEGFQAVYQSALNASANIGGDFGLFGFKVGVSSSRSNADSHGNAESLSEKDAAAALLAYQNALKATASSSKHLSESDKNAISATTGFATNKTEQSLKSYAESQQLSETATKLDELSKTGGGSFQKDLMLKVVNAAAYGDEQLGIRGLGTKGAADRLMNDKTYLEEITKKVVDGEVGNIGLSTKDKVDNLFTDTQGQINESKNHIKPPSNTSTDKDLDLQKKQNAEKVAAQGETWVNNMPINNAATTESFTPNPTDTKGGMTSPETMKAAGEIKGKIDEALIKQGKINPENTPSNYQLHDKDKSDELDYFGH